MDEPTLTVFLPNYNHARFLPEALKSLEQQTYQPREIIIIDDASTDNSVEIIERFADTHESVHFIRNEVNRGVVFNENRAIELASSSHFFGMSADDRIRPRLFAESMALLGEHPQAGFCSALSDRIDEQGRNQGLYPTPVVTKRPCYLSPSEVLHALRRHGTWFMGNTTIWRRQALLDSGEHTPELKFFYDGFMSQVLALRYGACFIPESLGEFRQVAGQLCQESQDVPTALAVYRLAAELMRTKHRELFPEDYVEQFERRSAANTIEALIDRTGREQIEYMRATLPKARLQDKVMLAGVWLAMRAQFCVAKLYLATVRHGFWRAVVRLLRLTILRPFSRSPRYKE